MGGDGRQSLIDKKSSSYELMKIVVDLLTKRLHRNAMETSHYLPELAALGWTNKDLYGRIDVSPETVSRWKHGKKPVPRLVKAYLELAILVHEKGFRVP